MLTVQSLSADSKDCVKFLRKVIRDNETARYGDGWSIRASDATKWRIVFMRTIKGQIGEPDNSVEVQTDFAIGMPADSRFGLVQSFDDSKPVHVSRPSYVSAHNSDCSVIAKLLSDGSRLSIVASSGSTHSSHEGLSFYGLEARVPGIAFGAVAIGGQTIAKDGRTLVSGIVSIS